MSFMQDVRTIIWDMDQTLYPYWESLAQYCHEATAHCALEMGLDMSKEEAFRLSVLSYKTRGTTTALFQEQHGLDAEILFRAHHLRMIERLIEPKFDQRVGPNPDLANMLKASRRQGCQHLILTNGSREWAEHLSGKIGIKEHFNVIMGADDIKLRQKGKSFTPFQAVLGKAGYIGDYSDVLVVEDTLSNMEMPKENGMKTAWVLFSNSGDYKFAKSRKPAHVDDVYDSPNSVMQAWLEANQPAKRLTHSTPSPKKAQLIRPK